MRKLIAAVAVLAAAALPAMAAGAKDKAPERLPVQAVRLVEDFQRRTYPGRVVAAAQVNVVSRVNGEILEVGFANGAIIKKGQLLYRLDSVKYEAAVKNAEAKVAEFKARTSYAESSYERNRRLLESKAISKDTLESASSGRDAYQATLAAAEADLVAARDDLKNCRITAPIDGKLGSTNFTLGNYVTPNSGTLVTLIQTSPIRVRFSISNRDFLMMFEGKSSHIRERGIARLLLADGKEFAEEGRIEYVDNAANEDTDTIQVFVLFPNADHVLKPGGTVAVILSQREGVKKPAVPPSAVMQDVMGAYVWVVGQDDVPVKRYVVRGEVAKDHQFIESGLAAGERVIVDGTQKVVQGVKIVPVAEGR